MQNELVKQISLNSKITRLDLRLEASLAINAKSWRYLC